MRHSKRTRLAAIILLVCAQINFSLCQERPNILIILADDMGYSDLGSYGGEINTPNIDRLASKGIRYRQFYNAARCCPTRAALMTGVYPHQAGMGWMAAADLGSAPYQGTINDQCVTIAEVLRDAGYSTYMTGKWHLTNERKIDGMVTDSWPTQRGFERYFGIIPGGANYFTPELYSGNKRYPAPENFYLTSAISDTTVKYIDQHFSSGDDRPMFFYVAYTAPHWPLHAPRKDIERYRDQYRGGWDSLRQARFERQKALGIVKKETTLSPRDEAVEPWQSLPGHKREEMAMRMAIYAAQIDVMDQGIGRIIKSLEDKKQLRNTLILFLSDNGACAEHISSGKSKAVTGLQDTFESYRIQWANVGSTPFREYKHYTHEGGIATPLIAHWPKGIDRKLNNSIVSDYGHVTDIMATCLEVGRAKYPQYRRGQEIVPLEGKSLVPHFHSRPNYRGAIYWEHEANIAMRDGKWKLVAKTPEWSSFSKASLELYDMEADPSEMNNLAARYPERVSSMYDQWTAWATRIGAFPLDTRPYGVRANAYKALVNGTFDDNLGGWRMVKDEAVLATIAIDTTGQLTGKKAVKVMMKEAAEQRNALQLLWNLRASRGEKYFVTLKAKGNRPSSFRLRFQRTAGGQDGIMDQLVEASIHAVEATSPSFEVPADGSYQLALDFSTLTNGDELLIDDVQLVRVGP